MISKRQEAIHLERLSKIKDYAKIWQDDFFQEYFVKKYAWNLPRAAFELFGVELTYQQIDIWNEYLKSGGWRGGMLAVSSGHGTGKTKYIGVLASLHLLCFYKSITRIQAPKLEQVKKYSFKEITTSLETLKSVRKIDNKLYRSKWSFLFDLIQINKEQIYIKGHQTDWYIEAVTAPRGDSTNLSGQHQLNYLLILDEASGIEDSHIEASLGALSEEFNSCVMFSQHTRLSGKFHEAVTIKSKAKGGVWSTLRLSSRLSPRVSREQLKKWLSTYTEDEIRVRVDGLPPRKEMGMLIANEEIERAYSIKNDIFNNNELFNQIIFSYDVGYTGYRDASIINIAELAVLENSITGKIKKYYKVVDIQEYKGTNGMLPTDFTTKVVFNQILTYLDEKTRQGKHYHNIYVIGDATAGGHEAFVKLEEKLLESQTYNFICKGLKWGTEKLYYEDKERFLNARAKGYVLLKENLMNDRLIITTDKYKSKIYSQLSQIPYKWTTNFRYQIASKEEMAKKGISSPDIGDTFAQLELINTEVVGQYIDEPTKKDKKNSKNEIEELLIDEEFEEMELDKLEEDIIDDDLLDDIVTISSE